MDYYLLSIPILIPICFMGSVGASMIYDYIQIKYSNNDKKNNDNNNNNDDLNESIKKEN
jgi:hypothetical protein